MVVGHCWPMLAVVGLSWPALAIVSGLMLAGVSRDVGFVGLSWLLWACIAFVGCCGSMWPAFAVVGFSGLWWACVHFRRLSWANLSTCS